MPNRCVILLWGIYQTEPSYSVNHMIAEILLRNIFFIKNISSGKLASMCHVSKTSITRFCRDMGYESFSELRMDLYTWNKTYLEKFDVPNIKNHADVYNDYLNQVVFNIEILKSQVPSAQIQALVRDLQDYSDVMIMGHMQSANTAMTFQQNLFCAGENGQTV